MFSIIIATYKKNRATINRAYPWSFMFGRIVNGFFTVLLSFFIYKYFFEGQLSSQFTAYTQQADYITYIVLGASIYVLGLSTMMNVGRALITELREGTLETIILSPASRIGYFIGCLIEQLGRSIIEFCIILVTGYILGAKLHRLFTIQTIIVLVLAIFSFFTMALVLSSVMLNTRDTYISQNTLFISMSFLCGIAFPITYLPVPVQYISHILPTTAALQLFRTVVISNGSLSANYSLIFEILILSILYFVIGMVWHIKSENKVLENIFG